MLRLWLFMVQFLVLCTVNYGQNDISGSSSGQCPKNCTCGVPTTFDIYRARVQDEVVNCIGQGFTEIPYWDIPCDIRVIEFSNNNIKKLTRSSFRGLQQLEYIYLKNNKIDYMEAATFAGLPNLKDVVLVENEFTDIDERPFWDGAFGGLSVQLDGNPFFCDQELRRTIENIEDKVSLSGVFCADGERRRPVMKRNHGTQVKGEYFHEIYMIIRKRLYSWQIGLIAGACWAFTWIVVVLVYFFWTWDEGKPRKQVTGALNKARGDTWSKAKKLNKMEDGRLEFEMDDAGVVYNDDGMAYERDPNDPYPRLETAEFNDRFYRDYDQADEDRYRQNSPRADYDVYGDEQNNQNELRLDDRYDPEPRNRDFDVDRDGHYSPRGPEIDPRSSGDEPRNGYNSRVESYRGDDYNGRRSASDHEYSLPRRSGREPEYRESVREDTYFPNNQRQNARYDLRGPERVPEEEDRRSVGRGDINEEFDI